MIRILVGVVIVFVAAGARGQVTRNKPLVCYYGSWAKYRQGIGKFTVANIKPELCDYITYTFVGLTASLDINLMDLDGDASALTDLRKRANGKTKLMLAIGGWNEGSARYSQMAATAASRQSFVQAITAVLQKYNFDGLDVDWEYPAQRGGSPNDKANFALLLGNLRAEFDKHGYKLSAAVGASQSNIDLSYNVPALDKYLDFVNVMTYDFSGSWNPVTGQNSPLYPRANDPADLSVSGCVQAWLKAGLRPAKLMLGVALYGRTFTLQDATQNGIGAAASGAGTAGQYSQEAGYLSTFEICQALGAGRWTVTYDNVQKNPYASKGNQWIGYDDVRSVTEKANYVNANGLGGVMVWSIDNEDANNVCGMNAFPLLQAINNVLANASPNVPKNTTQSTPTPTSTKRAPATVLAPTTTRAPITTTRALPTPSTSNTSSGPYSQSEANQKCDERAIRKSGQQPQAPELFADRIGQCTGYFVHCVMNNDSTFLGVRMNCPNDLRFNQLGGYCDWPNSVDECRQ